MKEGHPRFSNSTLSPGFYVFHLWKGYMVLTRTQALDSFASHAAHDGWLTRVWKVHVEERWTLVVACVLRVAYSVTSPITILLDVA